jgi:hypothetical protein
MKTPNSAKPNQAQTNQNSTDNNTRTTVISAIKSHLMAGKSITHNEAQTLYGTSRISSVIHILRKQGMDIRTDIIEVEAGKGKPTEHSANIARYTLAGGAK